MRFITDDDSVFDSKEDADAHQEKLDRIRGFDEAIQKTMVGRLRRMGPSVTVPKIMPAQTRGIRDAQAEKSTDFQQITTSLVDTMSTIEEFLAEQNPEKADRSKQMHRRVVNEWLVWSLDKE